MRDDRTFLGIEQQPKLKLFIFLITEELCNLPGKNTGFDEFRLAPDLVYLLYVIDVYLSNSQMPAHTRFTSSATTSVISSLGA